MRRRAAVTVTVTNDRPRRPSRSPARRDATVSATVTVAASARTTSASPASSFFLDGAPLGAEDTTAPYDVSWNTTTVTNGAHTLTAVARDAAGHETTPPRTVTVTTRRPRPVRPPSSRRSATVTVAATRSDDIGVAGVQFLLDGAPLGAEDTTAPYDVSWNTTTVANGPYA